MKALIVNGSPRKRWNTATLLKHALAGAEAAGAEAELVHLYDLTYTGCRSCFACKKIGGKSYGRCAVRDGISPVLRKALAADVLILGSPIYFGVESGMMRSFLERLLFPLAVYAPGYPSLYTGKARTALFYTMNVKEADLALNAMDKSIERSAATMTRLFGNCETLICSDTRQFTDYSKYESSRWDPEAKAKRRREVFPLDCQRAFALGRRLAESAGA